MRGYLGLQIGLEHRIVTDIAKELRMYFVLFCRGLVLRVQNFHFFYFSFENHFCDLEREYFGLNEGIFLIFEPDQSKKLT
jgi:hypothetical protein